MGLDMYLTAQRYISDYSDEDKPLQEALKKVFPDSPGTFSNIEVRAMYWRKANAIHKWFVTRLMDGDDHCQKVSVSEDELKELLDVCEQVLEDPSNGPTLLPTQSGFFFGSTDYDDGYISDVEHTATGLKRLLVNQALWDGEWTFTYQASW